MRVINLARRFPGRRRVARVAHIAGGHMCGRLADGNRAVMARRAGAHYFCMIHLARSYRSPCGIDMARFAFVGGADMAARARMAARVGATPDDLRVVNFSCGVEQRG